MPHQIQENKTLKIKDLKLKKVIRNSSGCKSSLSSHLISNNHPYFRLLFHFSDSFVNLSSNHTLRLQIFMFLKAFKKKKKTNKQRDRGLSDHDLRLGSINPELSSQDKSICTTAVHHYIVSGESLALWGLICKTAFNNSWSVWFIDFLKCYVEWM